MQYLLFTQALVLQGLKVSIIDPGSDDQLKNIGLPQTAKVAAPYANGLECGQCHANNDLPCSIINTVSLVEEARNSKKSFVPKTLGEQITNGEAYKRPGGFYLEMRSFKTSKLLGNGGHPSSVGMTMQESIEAAGNNVTNGADLHEDLKKVALSGGGWLKYKWQDKGGPVYSKMAYVIKLGKYYVTSGYKFEMTDLDTCKATHASACAEHNALTLLGEAMSRLLLARTQDELDETFGAITSDFKKSGFYVFVRGMVTSKCYAYGGKPGYVGKTLLETIKTQGISSSASALHTQFIAAADAGGAWVSYQWNGDKTSFVMRLQAFGKKYYVGAGYTNACSGMKSIPSICTTGAPPCL